MRAESAEGLMDLKERTKQFALCVIRMYSAASIMASAT